MNCFVIMPFATEFDDVYAVIKSTVEGISSDPQGRCFRLDDARPAGRITDRLLGELRTATICIADLTQTKPNVMWELGFAMALNKPTVIVTQSADSVPFDVKDMQSIEYDRGRLHSTLARPLRQSLLDTMGVLKNGGVVNETEGTVVSRLLDEMGQLKSIVGELAKAWIVGEKTSVPTSTGLEALSGHWFNTESGSHIYSRVVRGELVSPYCFGGDDNLTGVYLGWRRIGEYWFARYQWLDAPLSGFSFLRMNSLSCLSGAWWSSEDESEGSEAPPGSEGVPANWIRQSDSVTPKWAEDFFRVIEEQGLASVLVKSKAER